MSMYPLTAVPAIVQGSVQLVVGIYREVAPTHIMKQADGKYDKGIDVLEQYRTFMTPEQLEQIFSMAQRVEAARPPQPSGPTTLRDLLRNPFNKVTIARKYKRTCKEYLRLVQRMSQVARVQTAEREMVLAWSGKNRMLSPTPDPMTEACHGNSIPTSKVFDVPRAVALEIERAAGPGTEMSVNFCDVKLSIGAKTSIELKFTSSGIMTVNLGLIQMPSLTQRESDAASLPVACGEPVQIEAAVEGGDVPHHTRPQPNALGRMPSVISLSGTATIFPRQRDLHHAGMKADASNNGNIHDEDNGGGVTYALRFDNLECQAEGDATPTRIA